MKISLYYHTIDLLSTPTISIVLAFEASHGIIPILFGHISVAGVNDVGRVGIRAFVRAFAVAALPLILT